MFLCSKNRNFTLILSQPHAAEATTRVSAGVMEFKAPGLDLFILSSASRSPSARLHMIQCDVQRHHLLLLAGHFPGSLNDGP